jgi:hypothetical protein
LLPQHPTKVVESVAARAAKVVGRRAPLPLLALTVILLRDSNMSEIGGKAEMAGVRSKTSLMTRNGYRSE